MKPSVSDTPRTKNAAATKLAMLTSARRRFLQESYENVGLRDVAADVGVDVALVSRYFGSKEGLFKEVLRHGKEDSFPPTLVAATLPAHLADLITRSGQQADHENLERLLIILRSASSPKAAQIVRTSLHDDLLHPMSKLLDGEEAEVRASLATALLMGTTILRTVMSVEPICQVECALEQRLVALFEAALAPGEGPMPDAEPDALPAA